MISNTVTWGSRPCFTHLFSVYYTSPCLIASSNLKWGQWLNNESLNTFLYLSHTCNSCWFWFWTIYTIHFFLFILKHEISHDVKERSLPEELVVAWCSFKDTGQFRGPYWGLAERKEQKVASKEAQELWAHCLCQSKLPKSGLATSEQERAEFAEAAVI